MTICQLLQPEGFVPDGFVFYHEQKEGSFKLCLTIKSKEQSDKRELQKYRGDRFPQLKTVAETTGFL